MAFRGACWYSWPEQTRSLAAFHAHHSFRWLLPGHGARVHATAGELHALPGDLVERMRTTP